MKAPRYKVRFTLVRDCTQFDEMVETDDWAYAMQLFSLIEQLGSHEDSIFTEAAVFDRESRLITRAWQKVQS